MVGVCCLLGVNGIVPDCSIVMQGSYWESEIFLIWAGLVNFSTKLCCSIWAGSVHFGGKLFHSIWAGLVHFGRFTDVAKRRCHVQRMQYERVKSALVL